MTSPSDNGVEEHESKKVLYPTDPNEYKMVGEIGKGATATVFAAELPKRKEVVAVKRINLEKFNVNLDELLKEIQVMSQCKHENVVRFYTSFVVEHELWLVMKLLDGGSLLDVIRYTMSKKNCKNGVLDEVAIASVLKEVLKGLDYFHSNGHIHRDIKAGNILLALDGSVKIADFGVSAFIASSRGDITKDSMRHTFVGTPCWMAPEVMDQTPNGYDTKADIWSFGILGIELATGTAPYHKFPPVKVLVMTLQNDPPSLETCEEEKDQYKHYSKSFRKMLESCLQKKPTDRLTAKQLIKLDFFKKAKDKSYISKYLSVNITERTKADDESKHRSKPLSSRSVKQLITGEWCFDDHETESVSVNKASSSSSHETASESESVFKKPEQQTQEPDAKATSNKVNVRLTLRIRNQARQLNDIKFEYDPFNETCDLVASEMVNAGLINGVDRIIVACNMAKIVENPELKSVTFTLPSCKSEEVDQEKLIGSAMWIYTGEGTPQVN